jgi:hypothetical protein
MVPYKSYKLNAQSNSIRNKVSNIKDKCDILTQGLIRLIEYSYHQDISSFPEAHVQRTLGLSVLGLEQLQDG